MRAKGNAVGSGSVVLLTIVGGEEGHGGGGGAAEDLFEGAAPGKGGN